MKNIKPKKREITITEYYWKCPYCKMEITARGENHLKLNAKNHLNKHK